jgi:putative ABC transport system permease protein
MARLQIGHVFALALAQIRNHPLRVALTCIGVMVSVCCLVTVYLLTTGLDRKVSADFQHLGANTIKIQSNVYKALGRDRLKPLQVSQIALLEAIDGIEDIAYFGQVRPAKSSDIKLSFASTERYTRVNAISENFSYALHKLPISGRGLFAADEFSRQPVVLLSEEVATALGITADKLMLSAQLAADPTLVYLQDLPFEVVGILPGAEQDLTGANAGVYLSFAAAQLLSPQTPDVNFMFQLRHDVSRDVVLSQVRRALLQSFQTAPGEVADFIIDDAEALKQLSSQTIQLIRNVLLVVAFISLFIGCVGVVNVILSSVQERTQEFGIMRALGAKKSVIFWLVLAETLLMNAAAALVGLLLGYGLAIVIGFSALAQAEIALDLPFVLAVGAFTLVLSMICGVLPAIRACRISPVLAMQADS